MGYRSDVRIKLTKEDFEKLEKDFIEKFGNNSLFDYIDVKGYRKDYVYNEDKDNWDEIDAVYFGWNCVKWYEYDYEDVKFIMSFIKSGIPYAYSRIGEDMGDVELEGNNLEYITVRTEFEE